RAIFEAYAVRKPFHVRGRHAPANTHRVFTLHAVAGMHHAVGELPRGCQHEQSSGIEVEAPHGEPFAASYPRQPVENAGPAARIVTADDFSLGLVVEQDPGRASFCPGADRSAVDLDAVAEAHARADQSSGAIHRYAACAYPILDLATRAEPGLGERLLQFLGAGGQRRAMSEVSMHICN